MKSLLATFILFVLWMSAFCQSRVDSLQNELKLAPDDSTKINLYIQLWENTAYSHPDSAREYALLALSLSQKTDYKRGMADAYQRIASGYSLRSMGDSALHFYQKALNLYRELRDVKMEADMLFNIANDYYEQGDYVKAMMKTEESLKKSSEANDEFGIAVSLQLLGNIHHFLGNYEEAQKYLLQGLDIIGKSKNRIRYADGLVYLASNYLARKMHSKALENLYEAIYIYKKAGDSLFLAQAMNNAGYIHYSQKSYDSATYYFNRAVQLSEYTQNNSILLLALNNKGSIAKDRENFREAKFFYKRALKLAKEYKDNLRIAIVQNNLGELLAAQGKLYLALNHYDSSLNIAQTIGSKSTMKESYLQKSNAWSDLGNYQKALDNYKLYELMKDSLYNEAKTRKIEEMEARYEKARNEKEIAVQKSQIDILSKDLELQRIRQIALFIGLIATILLGIYFVFTLRNKMKRNRLIRKQERLLEEEKLKNAELQRDNYEKELAIKKNELTSHALQIVQKNELLDSLKSQITEFESHSKTENQGDLRKLKHMINGSAQSDKEWINFNRHFDQVHQGFLTRLKSEYPVLTSNDLRLSAMMKLNLSSKEVAAILNITPESVKKARYRLRKKLGLPEESDLHSFLMTIEN